MKKTILLPLLLLAATAAAAQDLIVRRDASRIEACVSEVSPDAVRYKRSSNPDGPTYVLPVGEIAYIRYANGDEDRFAPEMSENAGGGAVPAVRLQPAMPAEGAGQAADPSPEYVLREYAVGDYYDRGGVQGVVCFLTEDRLHGLVLSADQIYLPWCALKKDELVAIGADDRADGRRNMEAVARHIAERGLRWEDFPAFAWCRAKGDGWYLPAIDELLSIGHSLNGGSRLQSDRDLRNRCNDELRGHGGDKIDRAAYHISSTEKDMRDVLTTHMGIEPPYLIDIPKYTRFVVRAVHRF